MTFCFALIIWFWKYPFLSEILQYIYEIYIDMYLLKVKKSSYINFVQYPLADTVLQLQKNDLFAYHYCE